MSAKRAKTLSEEQYLRVLDHIQLNSRERERDTLIMALTMRAGLRACEVARMKMASLVDPDGMILPTIMVFGATSKTGRDREIPMHPEIKRALVAFRRRYPELNYVAVATRLRNGRHQPWTVNALTVWFVRFYASLGLQGCSSHSGRRTFITEMARRANRFHNSLYDVQQLAGHRRLDSTQCYIAPSDDTADMVSSLGREVTPARPMAASRHRGGTAHYAPKPHKLQASQKRGWPNNF
jgi:integrase